METTQTETFLVDKVFDRKLDPEYKRDLLDVVFLKFILPNLDSFIEVKESTFEKYRKSGIDKSVRWHDRRNNAFFITLFNKGPWFLTIDPPNSSEYGANQLPNRYYEIPDFTNSVNPVLLQERELFG